MKLDTIKKEWSIIDEITLGAYLVLTTFFVIAGLVFLVETYLFLHYQDFITAVTTAILTLISFWGSGLWVKRAQRKLMEGW